MHLEALTDYFNEGKFDRSIEKKRERGDQACSRISRALRALIDTETSERTFDYYA